MTERTDWHLDRKVPIVIILVLLGNMVGGVVYVMRMEARVGQLEHDQAMQRERDERQDKLVGEALSMVRAELARMSDKLDRLIEGRVAR